MSNLQALQTQIMSQSAQKQFSMALPSHIKPAQFQRVAWTAIQNVYQIDQCSPKSVMNALIKSAQDGLLPDGSEAAIVKYKTSAQYMPMVRGVIKKMLNSGMISDVNAHIIYQNDDFDAKMINGIWDIRHTPKLFGERGDVIGCYAVALYKDGAIHVEVMTKADIDKRKAKAKSQNVWNEWYEEMAKKTVIHALAKRVPCSPEFYEFVKADQVRDVTEPEAETKKESIIDNINEAIDAEYTERRDAGAAPEIQDNGGGNQESDNLTGVAESMER